MPYSRSYGDMNRCPILKIFHTHAQHLMMCRVKVSVIQLQGQRGGQVTFYSISSELLIHICKHVHLNEKCRAKCSKFKVIQGSHRLEKYLNIQGCLEKSP